MSESNAVVELRGDVKELKGAMTELAKSMAKMAENTARFEEKQIAARDRMDRIEDNQKEQGHALKEMHDAVLINTQSVKRIAWVSTVATGAFISGSMGFVFWLVRMLVEKGITP